MERKRLRDIRLRATALSTMAREAQNKIDREIETKIFVNPQNSDEELYNKIRELSDTCPTDIHAEKKSHPDKQSLVTFQSPLTENSKRFKYNKDYFLESFTKHFLDVIQNRSEPT